MFLERSVCLHPNFGLLEYSDILEVGLGRGLDRPWNKQTY